LLETTRTRAETGVLIAVNDAHGIPILAGLVIGAGLALVSPARTAQAA
jgi:hypothetical protein